MRIKVRSFRIGPTFTVFAASLAVIVSSLIPQLS